MTEALGGTLHMGVTLIENDHCGCASDPFYGIEAEELDRELERSGLARSWSTFATYVAAS